MAHEMTVLLAGYPTQDLCERDYRVLLDMEREKDFALDDLAVVARDTGGDVGIVHHLRHPVRKGLIAGAILGVLAPVSLIGAAAAGGLTGKLVGSMGDGLSRSTLKDLGDFLDANSVMIVLAGTPDVVGALESVFADATTVITKTIDENGKAIREHAEAGLASAPDPAV